jgi:hypothetical protein
MASDVKRVIAMPELDSNKGQFQLELRTYKGFNGQIVSAAHGQYVRDGMLTFELCGDFSEVYERSNARATQKALEAQHAAAFGPESIAAIQNSVRSFYAAKAVA